MKIAVWGKFSQGGVKPTYDGLKALGHDVFLRNPFAFNERDSKSEQFDAVFVFAGFYKSHNIAEACGAPVYVVDNDQSILFYLDGTNAVEFTQESLASGDAIRELWSPTQKKTAQTNDPLPEGVLGDVVVDVAKRRGRPPKAAQEDINIQGGIDI